MKKEIADRWVEALESGKYEQGRGTLNRNGKFCCLGVLCDILKEDLSGKWSSLPGGELMGQTFETNETSNLTCFPHDRYDYIGAKEQYAVDFQQTLISLNDTHGESFDEIAKYIRKNYRSF